VLTADTLIFDSSKSTTGCNNLRIVALEVLIVVTMKSTIFWDVMLCSSAEVHKRSSETFVNLYWNTWHNIPADSNLNSSESSLFCSQLVGGPPYV
jgi:hypothetical protein